MKNKYLKYIYLNEIENYFKINKKYHFCEKNKNEKNIKSGIGKT